MRAPAFWQRDGLISWLLAPLGAIYGAATARRLRRKGLRVAQKVICCGNATAGGTGKTILALAICDLLRTQDARPMFLTRGYGGSLRGPVLVDAAIHTVVDVGDEALLLAARAPTIVARDRAAGAALAGNATHLILDDGLQNPDLVKDVSFLLIDGGAGFGNGRMIPAGPLREPVVEACARVQAAILIGADEAGVLARLPAGLPVLRAALVPGGDLTGMRVLGFAGIGRPEKFRASLIAAGAEVVGFVAFGDHHPYSSAEIAALRAQAVRLGARLVTTEKDLVRLAEREGIMALGVGLRFDRDGALEQLLWAAKSREV